MNEMMELLGLSNYEVLRAINKFRDQNGGAPSEIVVPKPIFKLFGIPVRFSVDIKYGNFELSAYKPSSDTASLKETE